MQIIKTISSQIEEELEGAKSYARLALKNKEQHSDLAATYQKLAEAELDHVNRLHDAGARLINEYKDQHGEPPANMQAVYDYLHEKHIENAAEVRTLLDMYKR